MELSQVVSLACLLSLTLFTLPPPSSSTSLAFRAELTHVDAGRVLPKSDRIIRAAQRSKLRSVSLALTPVLGSPRVTVHPSQGEYLLDLSIGTPPLPITGILDTGSDLVWTQCAACISCIPQPSPLFDPFASSSFSPLPCAHPLCRALSADSNSACAPGSCFYHYRYGDDTDSVGFLGSETLTLGPAIRVPGVGFGCGLLNSGDIQNSSGVVGFGLGPVSLISQLRVPAFSYCFTDAFQNDDTKSPLFFGPPARLAGQNVRSTPLLKVNPASRPASTFYHVSLLGITVGETALAIPREAFRMGEDGSGGVIMDSGTAFAQLVPEAYGPLARAVEAEVKLAKVKGSAGSLKLCFKRRGIRDLESAFPRVVFHFEGADWELPARNYVVSDEKVACLAAMETSGRLSIFGNFQTQHFHVSYDLKSYKLSFMPARCEQL